MTTLALETNGVLSLTAAQNGATTITAGVRVSHEGTPLITLGYTLLVAEELRFSPISWRRQSPLPPIIGRFSRHWPLSVERGSLCPHIRRPGGS